MLSLEDVSKEYNLRPVLESVHLALQQGVLYTLMAPNGSGKTTLLQIMAGLTRPTKGRVLWDGQPVRARHRHRIGVLLQQPMLYSDLTAAENLRFYANLYGLSTSSRLVSDWLLRVGLTDSTDERVRNFSKGMRQRLALARCFLHEPELLLLDEPFDGLDEQGRAILAELLTEHVAAGASVFLVTHRSEEVNMPAQQLTLHFGRVIAC
ncbi:heme ABC exporter ATP-binding protein CcmA [Alicyclobacillus curvatus]|jgi:heme ABC exporter ATP-binding subunit CcmA|nr:heme ABC exporter ATP-binding protein CcmA [Alicyclobacillus curvatus]